MLKLLSLLIMTTMMVTAILGNLAIAGVKVYAICIFLLCIFTIYKKTKTDFCDLLVFFKNNIYFIFLYVLFCVLSLLWTDSIRDSLDAVIKLIFVSSLIFSVPLLVKQKLISLNDLGSIAFFSLCIILLTISFQIYNFGLGNIYNIFKQGDVQSGNSLFTWYVVSVFGESIFGNSQNVVAGYAVTVYGLFLTCRDKKYNYRILGDLIASVFLCLIILLSLSKSAFVGFFVILVALFLNRSSRFHAVLLSMVLSLLILQPFFPFKEGLLARFGIVQTQLSSVYQVAKKSHDDTEVKPDTAIDSRKLLWSAAIELFKSSPWIGHGYGGSRAVYQRTVSDGVNNPHNIILQSLADIGFVGTLFMLCALLNIAALAHRLFKRVPSVSILLSSIIFGYFCRAMFGMQFMEVDIWLPIAVLVAYVYILTMGDMYEESI